MIKKAMEAMHWNASSVMPMANLENQSILEFLTALKEQKEELMEHQLQTEERLEKLQQHSTNAKETINHNLVSKAKERIKKLKENNNENCYS